MIGRIYSEVYAILVALGEGYIDRIPSEMLDFIRKGQDANYTPDIDESKPLNKQNIQKETLATIAMLELNYWCNTDEEKAELLHLLEINEQKIKEVLESATCTRELLKLLKKK